MSQYSHYMHDENFMEHAIELAAAAENIDEIPVGAVIVKDNVVIAEGFNRNRSENDPTLHAEIIAIKEASKKLANERLTGCEIYITKEPCAMCAGAIVHARLKRVIIGAEDIKYGACGTVFNVCGNTLMNHVPEITRGVLQEECASILKSFFRGKRKNSKDINPDKETQG